MYNLEEPEHDDGSMTLASYVWDERDRMIKSVNSTATAYYVYGEDGERTNKYTADSETLYFSRLWTWHGDKSIDDQVSKHIYLGETRIVSKLNSSGKNGSYGEERGKTYFYHSDHLGSAQLITDYKGDEYQRIEYTPYGEAWVDKIEDPLYVYMPYKFTGKEMDSETGLYYYGSRYLDPQTSVWLSTDPALGDYLPTAGADNSSLPGMGGVFNTTNCHLYHYAGNNPVRYVDPDGRIKKDAQGNFISQQIDIDERKLDNGMVLIRGYVFLLADDGTPIEAWENAKNSHLPQYNSNCHGYTFAGGKFWIDDAQTIIEHDGYQEVSIPQQGDVVVYYDRHGTAVHSATIIKVEERKNWFLQLCWGKFKITVIGLSGNRTEPEITPLKDAPWGVVPWHDYKIYRKDDE